MKIKQLAYYKIKGDFIMNNLKQFISELTKSSFNKTNRVGGGFYADVYKFDGEKTVIVKVYKPLGMMEKEVLQLKTLSTHAISPMPEILYTHKADEHYNKDILVMSFLSGDNGGNIHYLNSKKRENLANQAIENLLAFHNVSNPEGFGEINSKKFYPTFNEYYKEKAEKILEMGKSLKDDDKLPSYVYDVTDKAVKNFDKIFYLPITKSALIHGDYNMWNILADKKTATITAVIDPCGAMWADNEYDLYQLNNANGKHLKLFDTYKKYKALSENHKEKMAFYELFTEVEHYYNSGYPVIEKLVKKQSENLNAYL